MWLVTHLEMENVHVYVDRFLTIYADRLLETETRASKLSKGRQYYHSALVDVLILHLPRHLCPKAIKCGKKSKTRLFHGFRSRLDVYCYYVFQVHA